jgi:hypothetical protein
MHVYQKKVIVLQHAIVCELQYSVYEQIFFIFGKIRLLANEWHIFHAKWKKISKYESDKNCYSQSHIFTSVPN